MKARLTHGKHEKARFMLGPAEARPAGGPERVGLQKWWRSLFWQLDWPVVIHPHSGLYTHLFITYVRFFQFFWAIWQILVLHFGQSSCSILANPRAPFWLLSVLVAK